MVTRSGSKHFPRVTHCRDFIENGQSVLPSTVLSILFEKKSPEEHARRWLAQFAGELCGNSRQSLGRCASNRRGEVREWLFPSSTSAGRANGAADTKGTGAKHAGGCGGEAIRCRFDS